MNNISLNIVANAEFQQVYAEVARLKASIASLQKVSVGGPFTPAVTSSIRSAQSAFDSAVLSTRAFTIEHVKMSDSVMKFGKDLSAGRLSLSHYYNIWRDSAKGVSAELDTLATTQARLNRSIAVSDPLRPGYAKLVTDINGVVTAQEKQLFYQRALNTALQQGSVHLINFGKNTQWMGRQLTVGLTMPLTMFGAAASKAFQDVDKELTRLVKVYGTGLAQPTHEILSQIRSDVLGLGNDLARSLGVSVKETASMAADLAATGQTGANLISATREALRMATLGELDHAQAMQATISLQNVYKLNTQGLTEAVNFLNAVENQTSTSLQDLVTGIPKVGPIVAQLGGSFKDTAAMMVAMKEAGVPAAQSANAIKSAIASMINPTTQASEMFKKYNINVAQITKNANGNPIQMILGLQEAIKGLDKLTQTQLLDKLFGKMQLARVQALITNIGKAGSQTQTVFQLMGASSTDLANLASNELKTATESASGKFKRMTETLKSDLIPIGQEFLNSFSKIGFLADKVLNVFKEMAKVLGPVGKMLGIFSGTGLAGLIVIGPVIMLIGLFANLVGNILRVGNSMKMFKQGMDSAASTENRFMAGLRGMRNFYAELDTSVIAARNQMDLMPEAITSNAKAFEILKIEIMSLTEQFKILGIAQQQAMTGMVDPSKLRSTLLNTKNPRLPGFANGVVGLNAKDTIPAMLAPGETVITAEATAKYSPILNAMNRGTLKGFSGGVVNYNGEEIPINLREKRHLETVKSYFADPSFSEEVKSALANYLKGLVNEFGEATRTQLLTMKQAIEPLNIEGFNQTRLSLVGAGTSGGSRPSYLPSPAELARRQRPGKQTEYEFSIAKQVALAQQKALEESGLASSTRINQAEQISGSHITPVGSILKKWSNSRANRALGNAVWSPEIASVQGQESNQFAEEVKREKNNTQFIQYLNKEKEQQIAAMNIEGKSTEEQISLEKKFTLLQKKINSGVGLSNEELLLQGQVSSRMLTAIRNNEVDLKSITNGFQSYLVSSEAASVELAKIKEIFLAEGNTVAEWEALGARTNAEISAGLKVMREEAVRLGNTSVIAAVDSLIIGMKEALKIASPSKVAKEIGIQTGLGAIEGLATAIPEMAVEGAALGNAAVKTFERAGISSLSTMQEEMSIMQERINSQFLVSEGLITAETSLFAAKTKSKFGGMGGMAGMMLAPMAISAIPNKVAGQDISGLKGIAQSAISMGFMAQMFKAGSGGWVGGAIAAAGLLSIAFKKLATDARESSNFMTSTFTVSKQASTQFGLSLNNLSNIHLLDTTAKTKNLSAAMKENSAAIDTLTSSYKNSTDQQTKDTLKIISKMSISELNDWANKKLATDMTMGLSKKDATRDISALISASGRGLIGTLGLNLGSYKNSSTAMSAAINGATVIPVTGGQAHPGTSGASQTASNTANILQSLSMTSPTNFKKTIALLDEADKSYINLKENAFRGLDVFSHWNKLIRASNPELAKLNDTLHGTGVETTTLAQATSLVNAGLIVSTAQYENAAKSLSAMNDLMAAYGVIQSLSTVREIIPGSNDATVADNKKLISDNEAKIKALEDEKTARDALYNAQMRNIQAQQQQMNLNADLFRARGAGDLIGMALAKSAITNQRTQDNMQTAKDNADKITSDKIAELQKRIADLNVKNSTLGSSGTAPTSGPSQRETAQSWVAQATIDASTNVQAFINGMGDSYKLLLKAKMTPEQIAKLFKEIFTAMDWTNFSSNSLSIMMGLLKTFGTKLGLSMFQSIADSKIKEQLTEVLNSSSKAAKIISDMNSTFDAQIQAVENSSLKNADKTALKTKIQEMKTQFGVKATEIISQYTSNINSKDSKIRDAAAKTAQDAMQKLSDNTQVSIATALSGIQSSGIKALAADSAFSFATTLSNKVLKDLGLGVAQSDSKQKGKEVADSATSAIDKFLKAIFPAVIDPFTGKVYPWISGPIGAIEKLLKQHFPSVLLPFTELAYPWLKGVVTSISNWIQGLFSTPKGKDLGSVLRSKISQDGAYFTVLKNAFSTKELGVGDTFESKFDDKTRTLTITDVGDKTTVTAIARAAGGHILGAGTATSDSIPAYLSNGEYVVKADSVKKYGVGFFDSVNAQRLSSGGMAGGANTGAKLASTLLPTKPSTKNGWLQKWAKSISGMPGAEMMGTASLLRSLAGIPKKGDTLGTAALLSSFVPIGKVASVAPKVAKELKLLEDALAPRVGKFGRYAVQPDIVSEFLKTTTLPKKDIGLKLLELYQHGQYDVTKVQGYQSYIDTLRQKASGDFFRGMGIQLFEHQSSGNKLNRSLPKDIQAHLMQAFNLVDPMKPTQELVTARKNMFNELIGHEFIMPPASWTENLAMAQRFATQSAIGVSRKRPFVLATKINNTKVIPVSKLLPDTTYAGNKLMEEMESIFGGKFKIDGVAKDGMKLSQVISKANGGMISAPKYSLPSFDVGTNYVPRDMIAQIHKGEAIIPASQNNGPIGSTVINVYPPVGADANQVANLVLRKLDLEKQKQYTMRRVNS